MAIAAAIVLDLLATAFLQSNAGVAIVRRGHSAHFAANKAFRCTLQVEYVWAYVPLLLLPAGSNVLNSNSLIRCSCTSGCFGVMIDNSNLSSMEIPS